MKESDHFETPDSIKNAFPYFDPCPIRHNLNNWNGLKIDWPKKVFCNPPYSEIEKWLLKAIEEVNKGNSEKVIFLLPAWTDRKWFHNHIYLNYDIKFLKGRVKFKGGKYTPRWGSMLVWIK